MGLYRYEAFSTTRYLGLIGTLIGVYHEVYIIPIGYQFLPKIYDDIPIPMFENSFTRFQM